MKKILHKNSEEILEKFEENFKKIWKGITKTFERILKETWKSSKGIAKKKKIKVKFRENYNKFERSSK